MHTGILFAVEADDLTDAISQAEGFADACEWSDGSEQAGRFAESDKSVVKYSDNPELFQDLVDKFQASTEDEIRQALELVGNLTVSELVINPRYRLFRDEDDEEVGIPSPTNDPKDTMEVFSVFNAAKVLRLVAGYFTPETHFWDITWGTRGTRNLKERIAENPDKQYVIVWDFHY